jgi:hypothetical protein
MFSLCFVLLLILRMQRDVAKGDGERQTDGGKRAGKCSQSGASGNSIKTVSAE